MSADKVAGRLVQLMLSFPATGTRSLHCSGTQRALSPILQVADLRQQVQRLKAQNTSLRQQVGDQQAQIERLGAAPPRRTTASPQRARSPARAGTPPGSSLRHSVQGEAGQHAGQPEGDTAAAGRLPLQPVQAQAALPERVRPCTNLPAPCCTLGTAMLQSCPRRPPPCGRGMRSASHCC